MSQDKAVCIRYPKDLVPNDNYENTACNKPFELGKSIFVKKTESSVLSIVTYGPTLTAGIKASQTLAAEGIETDLINARFAAPIDQDILTNYAVDKPIITVEDHQITCGFGSALLEAAAMNKRFNKPIVPLASPRMFIKHDSRQQQLIQVGINADNIVQTVKNILGLNKNIHERTVESKNDKKSHKSTVGQVE